ncbi:MAG: RsmD family RNA methyltransferase [Phycisphaeraceae bacterium]|nr:RsmD family RNA methyltransferase [Phycisphaeraceae bacterium]
MRIIGGEFKRRLLESPPDADTTRPMPDLVREALFNLLRGHTEDVAVVDLFAGTGSIGLEAISRGARRCVFVESNRRVGRIIERNILSLGVAERCHVLFADALGPQAIAACPRPLHLAFVDPPYAIVRDPDGWHKVKRQMSRLAALLDDDGFAVLRTPWPLLHAIATEAPERPKHRPRRPAPFIDEQGDLMEDISDEPEIEREPAEPVRYADVDMAVEEAQGPETRTYGGMALHLYMRRR